MKITRIKVFAIPLPYATMGHSRLHSPEVGLDDTVVSIETDTGIIGWGESCPLFRTYLPVLAGGLRAAVDTLAPFLIGKDPREVGAINGLMDRTLLGHGYAKAALDMACWDILGKATGLPLTTLLGGAQAKSAPVYKSVPVDEPAKMVETLRGFRAAGLRAFQVKLGEGAEADIPRMRAVADDLRAGEVIFCDANRGWTKDDARRMAMAADYIDPEKALFIEQPCATYGECQEIRRMCRRPMILDEVIDDITDLTHAIADGALDGLVIKLSHAGGLTKAREMIALALSHGIKLRIEDTVGAEFVRSAVASLAVTIPPRMLLATYPHPAPIKLGSDGTALRDGRMHPGESPGLGVEPDLTALREPIAVYG